MNPQPEKTDLEKRLEEELRAQAAAASAGRRNDEEPDELLLDEEEDLPEMIPDFDVDALVLERDDLKNQLLRSRAEFDNYRKRVAREAEQARLRAAESLLRDLLPVVDNLELAVQHADEGAGSLAEGIRMVVRQFHDVLRRAGVEPISAVGETFDPSVHEAVMQAPSAEVAPNTVAQEFQKGYRLGEYVLRPARVVVSSGGPEDGSEGERETAEPEL
jgi:molecular chaperone GrpE